jgi:hypothetical protein
MKKLCLAAILLCAGIGAFSLDLSAVAGLGNLSFDTERKTPIGNGGFEPFLYPLVLVKAEGDYSDMFGLYGSFERDPILRNRLGGEAKFTIGPLSIAAGPFAGLFNSPENAFRIGFSGGVGLNIPGIFFVGFRGSTTLGPTDSPGDYHSETISASAGFWLPNLVNTLSFSVRNFNLKNTAGSEEDRLWRIEYNAEIYSKGVPYTVRIDMGYQSLTRSYTTDTDEVCSVFLGFETDIALTPLFKIRLGAEMPVYCWGKYPLGNPDTIWLFQARGGFVYTINP